MAQTGAGLAAIVIVCLLTAGCGRPDAAPAESELRSATLRLEVQRCGAASRQWATAVVLEPATSVVADTTLDPTGSAKPDEPAIVATVAHTFVVDGEVSAQSFTVFDDEGGELDARLTFIDPATDVALLTLSSTRPGLMIGLFVEPDETSRLVLYPESGSAPAVTEVAVVRETIATVDGFGARRALELAGSVKSGDSGAPVVDDRGRVIGLVFATSTSSETSWAIATSEFEVAMAQAAEAVELTCE